MIEFQESEIPFEAAEHREACPALCDIALDVIVPDDTVDEHTHVTRGD